MCLGVCPSKINSEQEQQGRWMADADIQSSMVKKFNVGFFGGLQ